MKYLFFDIECADGGKATICSFEYVIADENSRESKRNNWGNRVYNFRLYSFPRNIQH